MMYDYFKYCTSLEELEKEREDFNNHIHTLQEYNIMKELYEKKKEQLTR